jgi:hypothetical protein
MSQVTGTPSAITDEQAAIDAYLEANSPTTTDNQTEAVTPANQDIDAYLANLPEEQSEVDETGELSSGDFFRDASDKPFMSGPFPAKQAELKAWQESDDPDKGAMPSAPTEEDFGVEFSIPIWKGKEIGFGMTFDQEGVPTMFTGTQLEHNAEIRKYAGKGYVVDKPASMWDAGVFAMTEETGATIRAKAGTKLFKTSMKLDDGRWFRKIDATEEGGESKWAAVDSIGMTVHDFSSFAVAEALPFLLGWAGQSVAELADPASKEQREDISQQRRNDLRTGARLTDSKHKGPLGFVMSGATKVAVGGAAVYLGEAAKHMFVKNHLGMSDEEFPIEAAMGFDDPKAKAAYFGMAAETGFRSVIAVSSFIGSAVTGNKIPDVLVRALQNLHEEYVAQLPAVERVNAAMYRTQFRDDLAAETGITPAELSVTLGEATDNHFILNVEAGLAEEASNNVSTGHASDIFQSQQRQEDLALAMHQWVGDKYGATPGSGVDIEDLSVTENAIGSVFKARGEALSDGLANLEKAASSEVDFHLDSLAVRGGTVQTQAEAIKKALVTSREAMSEEFNAKYTNLVTEYGGLSGPNTHIAEMKVGFLGQLDTILEPIAAARLKSLAPTKAAPETLILDRNGKPMPLSNTADTQKFLERSANPGEVLTYGEVDDTLKALRSLRREVKDTGAQAALPGVATLDIAIKAYKLEREAIASGGVDGGALLARTDKEFQIGKQTFDNIEVRKLLATIQGDAKKGSEEFMASIFSPNKTQTESTSNDIISKLVPALDGDHKSIAAMRQAFINEYRGLVTDEASHKTFTKSYGGALHNLFGEMPPTFADTQKLWEQVPKDAKILSAKLEVLASHPLMDNNVSGAISRIAKTGTKGERNQLGNLLADNPTLQKDYLREYMKALIDGGVEGFQKVIDRRGGGEVIINNTALQALVGHIKKGFKKEGGGDPVLAMFGGRRSDETAEEFTERSAPLTDVLTIAQMLGRKGDLGGNMESKSIWAQAFQILMGPLSKETRAVNAADLYLRHNASREIRNVLADPKKLENFLANYPDPASWEKALKHNMYSLTGRTLAAYSTDEGEMKGPMSYMSEEEMDLLDRRLNGESLDQSGLGIEYTPGDTREDEAAPVEPALEAPIDTPAQEPPQAPVSPPTASSPQTKPKAKGITNIPSVAPKVAAGETTGNALKAKSLLEGKSIVDASKKRLS